MFQSDRNQFNNKNMESPSEIYSRPSKPAGKFHFYSTGSPDIFYNGIEVNLEMSYNPQQCEIYLKSQLQGKIENIDNYKLLIYLSGGIPFLGGTLGDLYSDNDYHAKPYIYGVLTRPISDEILNISYTELCNISDKDHKFYISPICESTENGLIDMACILGYLQHNGVLWNRFLKSCAVSTHFPPLITCLKRICERNGITVRDVVTVTSSLHTLFTSLIVPTPKANEVFNSSILCCNYIINIKNKNGTYFPICTYDIDQNKKFAKLFANLKQPKIVYIWDDDINYGTTNVFVYSNLKPFKLSEIEKIGDPIFISFTPIAPLLVRTATGCSIMRGNDHNYLYLSQSFLKEKANNNMVNIIDPVSGIADSIDIEKFAQSQLNTQTTDTFKLIEPDQVEQVVLVCLDDSGSMNLNQNGQIVQSSDEISSSTAAIQYLTIFANKIYGYKIPSIQGLIKFNNKIELSVPFTPLSTDLETKGLKRVEQRGKSRIWDALSFACDKIEKFTLRQDSSKKFKNAVNRILVITDGDDKSSAIPFIDLVKKIIEHKIVVDSIVFGHNERCLELCALCHITGGLSFKPSTFEQGIYIIEKSAFVNFNERPHARTIPSRLESSSITEEFLGSAISSSSFDVDVQNKFVMNQYNECKFSTPRSICYNNMNTKITVPRHKRIMKELHYAAKMMDPTFNHDYDNSVVILPLTGTLDVWHAFVKGCDFTPYSGKWFNMAVTFPELYPIEPPKFRFLSVPYNLNVSSDGLICCNILDKGYLPSLHVYDIINEIKEIFLIPEIETPMQITVLETFIASRKRYEKIAFESAKHVGRDDYKEFLPTKATIRDEVPEDFKLDSNEEQVPEYMKIMISGMNIKDPVLLSSGVYYEREELKQLISKSKNPVCIVTGKALTETVDEIDGIYASDGLNFGNKTKSGLNYENKTKSGLNLPTKTQNLAKLSLIDQNDFYKLFEVKENKTGKVYAAAVFYQNIESYSKKERNKILKLFNKMIKISHPSIIKCIKFKKNCFGIEHRLTLFTEFVNQVSLRFIIEQNAKSPTTKIDDTDKLIIIFGIASAMSYLHSHRILHRDLTASNVYIDKNGYPKLANIGMKSILKGLKSMERIPSLSFYQPPELYFENKYSKKSEVYSFALTVYEILSNKSLFDEISFASHLNNMKQMWRPQLENVIPNDFHSLIKMCWSQDPKERPSFDTIVEKLKVFKNSKNIRMNKFNEYVNFVDNNQKGHKEKGENGDKDENKKKGDNFYKDKKKEEKDDKDEDKKKGDNDDKDENKKKGDNFYKDKKKEEKDDKDEDKKKGDNDDKDENKKKEDKNDKDKEQNEEKDDDDIDKDEYEEEEEEEEEEFFDDYEVNEDEEFNDEEFEEEELNESEKRICENLLSKKIDRIDIKQYKRGNEIGRGGFGIVYKALKRTEKEQQKSKKRQKQEVFASKIYPIDVSDENYKNLTKSFLNELILHSRFSLPSIVKFIGYSPLSFVNRRPRRHPLMMMEFVQKGSLQSIIQKVQNGIQINRWNSTQKLIVIYGIAATMNYLHSLNILHRDLKPENVLIDENFFPKLTDFGISIEISEISNEDKKEVKGTGQYIAPEIWRNANYCKASDVYSFAILVYELMSNKFMLANVHAESIGYTILFTKYRPKLSNKQIPESYINLIKLCWDDDPNERPPFDAILKMLKEDVGFRNGEFDDAAYEKYVGFIDEKINEPPETICASILDWLQFL